MLSIRLCYLFAVLFVHISLCTSQSLILHSPSAAPELADAPSVAPDAPSPKTAPLGSFTSPPAPPPSDLAPDSAPETAPTSTLPPSPDAEPPVPSPSPDSASDINRGLNPSLDDTAPENYSGGMSGGKKAGIAFVVIFLSGLVVVGAVVYKKRQENIRRSRYSSNARLDFT